MQENARRIVGAGHYGLDGRCQWPMAGGEVLALQVEDGLEVFLTVAEALGMDAAERDDVYTRLAGRAAKDAWRRTAQAGREALAEKLLNLLCEAKRRVAWLEYRLAMAEREL